MNWDRMWGGETVPAMRARIVLQEVADEKPLPVTARKRRNLSGDAAREIEDKHRALMRYLAGGRCETCKEISAGLGFEAAQVISTLSRTGLLIRVSGRRSRWMLP